MRTFGIPRNLGSSSTGKKMRILGIPRNLGYSSTGKKIWTFGIPIILGSSATGKKVITSGIPRTLGMRFFWNYVFVFWFLCWLRKSPLWNPGGYKKVLELWLSPKIGFSLKNVFFLGGNSWGVVTSSRMTWICSAAPACCWLHMSDSCWHCVSALTCLFDTLCTPLLASTEQLLMFWCDVMSCDMRVMLLCFWCFDVMWCLVTCGATIGGMKKSIHHLQHYRIHWFSAYLVLKVLVPLAVFN